MRIQARASNIFAVSICFWRCVYSFFIVETFGNCSGKCGGLSPPVVSLLRENQTVAACRYCRHVIGRNFVLSPFCHASVAKLYGVLCDRQRARVFLRTLGESFQNNFVDKEPRNVKFARFFVCLDVCAQRFVGIGVCVVIVVPDTLSQTIFNACHALADSLQA